MSIFLTTSPPKKKRAKKKPKAKVRIGTGRRTSTAPFRAKPPKKRLPRKDKPARVSIATCRKRAYAEWYALILDPITGWPAWQPGIHPDWPTYLRNYLSLHKECY